MYCLQTVFPGQKGRGLIFVIILTFAITSMEMEIFLFLYEYVYLRIRSIAFTENAGKMKSGFKNKLPFILNYNNASMQKYCIRYQNRYRRGKYASMKLSLILAIPNCLSQFIIF